MQRGNRLIFQNGLHSFGGSQCPDTRRSGFHWQTAQGIHLLGQSPPSEAGQHPVDFHH